MNIYNIINRAKSKYLLLVLVFFLPYWFSICKNVIFILCVTFSVREWNIICLKSYERKKIFNNNLPGKLICPKKPNYFLQLESVIVFVLYSVNQAYPRLIQTRQRWRSWPQRRRPSHSIIICRQTNLPFKWEYSEGVFYIPMLSSYIINKLLPLSLCFLSLAPGHSRPWTELERSTLCTRAFHNLIQFRRVLQKFIRDCKKRQLEIT